MQNKKTTIALTAAGLISATLVSLFVINKAIDKVATAKSLLNNRNKEIYHWRFGDINYSVTGVGKPVLLIHNLKEDSSSVEWLQIISGLSMNHTVYTIDLLGCGLSDRPDMICTSFMYTQLVSDFVHDIIKKKTDIVVTGKSAAFVLEACINEPDLYGDLVLINPDSIRNFRKAPSKRTKAAVYILKLKIIGTFVYHMMCTKKRICNYFEEDAFYDKENISKALIDYYYESAHIGGMDAKNLYISLIGRYTNTNVIRALKEINNNVHILASEELPNARKNMKEYQYHNPAVEVEYLDYVKELPQLEAPEKILDYLKIYL